MLSKSNGSICILSNFRSCIRVPTESGQIVKETESADASICWHDLDVNRVCSRERELNLAILKTHSSSEKADAFTVDRDFEGSAIADCGCFFAQLTFDGRDGHMAFTLIFTERALEATHSGPSESLD